MQISPIETKQVFSTLHEIKKDDNYKKENLNIANFYIQWETTWIGLKSPINNLDDLNDIFKIFSISSNNYVFIRDDKWDLIDVFKYPEKAIWYNTLFIEKNILEDFIENRDISKIRLKSVIYCEKNILSLTEFDPIERILYLWRKIENIDDIISLCNFFNKWRWINWFDISVYTNEDDLSNSTAIKLKESNIWLAIWKSFLRINSMSDWMKCEMLESEHNPH